MYLLEEKNKNLLGLKNCFVDLIFGLTEAKFMINIIMFFIKCQNQF